jgi:GT2 family glycosyltransferase
MQITAIILNYQNYKDIRQCVLSLEGQTLPNNYQLKILIIDNSPSDEDTKRLQLEFSQHNYIFNDENKGFAKGVNQGIKQYLGGSDYFLLVNNDAELEKECLHKLLEEKADITGPTIFYKNKTNKIWQAGGYYQKSRMNIQSPLKNKKLPKNIGSHKVDFLSGCVLLINKQTIEKIGLFDENFFFYGEDLDFCLRAKNSGLKIVYSPNSSAWHNIEDISQSRTNPFVLDNLAKSYFLIIRKHFPAFLVYGIFLFLFLYTPFRLYQLIKGKNKISNIFYWFKSGKDGIFKKI